MSNDEIVATQLDFFARNLSGCAFAAMAARDPIKFEWAHHVIDSEALANLDTVIEAATADPAVSTLSIVFRDVVGDRELDGLIPSLVSENIYLHETLDTLQNRCYRFRAKIGEDESFVSGFGPFDYLPKTRRTPYTSVVMRVKPRPNYEWHLKEPEEGIIHVADMDMKGLPDRNLQRMWRNSFLTVAGLLGRKPDQESAAKTTFVIPLDRAEHISL